MRQSVADIITNFKSFIGNGWVMWAAFCVALLLCIFLGKEKRKKITTVSVLLCVIILNPVTYRLVGERFLSGVYWRLFWTLPIVIALAAVLTELTGKVRQNWLRLAAVAVGCIAIALTGKSVINRGTYTAAENEYQIPQAAIDVADVVLEASGGTPVRIVAPDDLVCYIRQYTSRISMAYGRDSWGFIGVPEDWERLLYEQMHAETIDYQTLRETAVFNECGYIVFDTELIEVPENMAELGYTLTGTTGKYDVYALEEE